MFFEALQRDKGNLHLADLPFFIMVQKLRGSLTRDFSFTKNKSAKEIYHKIRGKNPASYWFANRYL